MRYFSAIKRSCVLIILLLIASSSSCFSQGKNANSSGRINGIFYEMSVRTGDAPLVIIVPGFTQYNMSQEFIKLKKKLEEFGWSFLILNPPEHGHDSMLSEGNYSWGENEPSLFLHVLDTLGVWKQRNIHLLGFSIGAKIVLEMSRLLQSQPEKHIQSVVSVASPTATGDINLQLSGDLRHPFECFSRPIQERMSLLRLFHLSFVDLPLSQLNLSRSPIKHIDEILSPILFIHSTDDWLIRSYQSLQLYNEATNSQHREIRYIPTYLHAESMLTEDSVAAAKVFYRLLFEWIISFSDSPWTGKTTPHVQKDRTGTDPSEITMMPYPSQYHPSTGLWWTSASYVPRFFSLDAAMTFSSHFLTYEALVNTRIGVSLSEKLKMAGGITFSKDMQNSTEKMEAYGSIFYPIGSLLSIRRIGYFHGIGNGSNRSIVSIDAALSLLGFQVNYGTIDDNVASGNITLDVPLIANGTGSFLLGVGLDEGFGIHRRSNSILRTYIQSGPRISFADSRLRFSASMNMPLDKVAATIVVFGVSINPREYLHIEE